MAVTRNMPRVQSVVLPILRDAFPDAQVVSWVPDGKQRHYPVIGIRRLGGIGYDADRLGAPVIELTVYHDKGLVEAEDLYLDALKALFDAVRNQTVTPAGHLSSIKETLGMTQFDSPFSDTWRIQGLIQLGLRPPLQA